MTTTFLDLNLHDNINKAIVACGYDKPTPIQAKSIPEILAGHDVVACAQTGSGKTAAFVLPALNHLCSKAHTKKTRILILTPTRELANQITKAADTYGKFARFNIVSLVGGVSYNTQIRDLSKGADIIVATPGRLMDHMEQRRVDLSNIDILVLDEADRMLDMGFIEDVEYIAKLTPKNRQTLLFSATVDKKLATIVKHLLKDPVKIDVSDNSIAKPKIKQEFYKVTSPQQKAKLLRHFLNKAFKAIIFTATKVSADRLADRLREDGYEAAALHGDLRQNVRTRTVDQLRRGKVQFLVATDVAARGIDISDITHVFNYDLPRMSEDYVHRIGRTGRAGKTGIAISFVMPTDSRIVKSIERYLGERIQVIQSVNMDDDEGDSGRGHEKRTLKEAFLADDEPHARRENSRSAMSKKPYYDEEEEQPKHPKGRTGGDFWRKEKNRMHDESRDSSRKPRSESSDAPRRERDGGRDFTHKKSEDRGGFARKSRDGERSFARKPEGEKREFPRRDRESGRDFAPKKSDDRGGFARKSRDGERSFARKPEGEKREFPRRDRDGGRDFAPKKSDDRGGFARKGRDGERSFARKPEGEKREFPRRDRDGGRDFAPKKSDDRGSFARKSRDGERSFARKPEGDRGESAHGRPGKSRDGQRTFVRKTEDARPSSSRDGKKSGGSDRGPRRENRDGGARKPAGRKPFSDSRADKPAKKKFVKNQKDKSE